LVGWIALTEYLPIVATVGVLVQAVFFAGKYEEQRPAKFRFGRQQWLLVIFIVLVLLWIVDAIFYINVYHLIELLLCIVLLTMGYIVYFNPTFFDGPVVKKQPNLEQFAGYEDEASIQALKAMFAEQKVFLRPRLTLEELSAEMGLPVRYISYLINHICKSNFNQFVNSYRVAEVLQRMEDPQNNVKTLLGIALDSGFSSKSSFNTAFKAITGKAPSTFLKDK
jgi:AraC-like DNA-binding protein